MKNILINLGLLLVAILLVVLAGEAIARLVLPVGDYLQPELFRDRYGVRIKPGTVGHDEWGFRNRAVPARAEIVAIGDSNTYGVAAVRHETWPAFLQELTGRTVYNLGMPGYDTLGYAHLFRSQALRLDPDLVLIGFYLGNDAWGAYNTFSRLEETASEEGEGESAGRGEEEPILGGEELPDGLSAARLRVWLARRSVLYNVVRYSGAVRFFYDRLFSGRSNGGFRVSDPVRNIRTVLQPRGLRAVDLEQPRNREGLRLSLETISEISVACRRRGIDLVVVLIPSKVAVYSGYLPESGEGEDYHRLRTWVVQERKMNELVRSDLAGRGISCLDVLPRLQRAAAVEAVYPGNDDTHPNRAGYRVIARAVADFLAGGATEPRPVSDGP